MSCAADGHGMDGMEWIEMDCNDMDCNLNKLGQFPHFFSQVMVTFFNVLDTDSLNQTTKNTIF